MGISSRKLGLGIILLLAILFGVEAIQSSWTFRACKSDYENDIGNQQQTVLGAPFLNKASRYFYVRLRCDGKFVIAHPEVISFFAVGLISLFTVILWIFVSRILRVTQNQLQLTNRSMDLTKNLLLSIYKPELAIRNFSLVERNFAENQKIHVSFTVTNKGNSDAVITEAATAVIVISAYIPADVPLTKRPLENVTLKSGEASHWPVSSATDLSADDMQAVKRNERRIVCIGHFTYKDALGTFRMTGFARQYEINRRKWTVLDDSDYEYSF